MAEKYVRAEATDENKRILTWEVPWEVPSDELLNSARKTRSSNSDTFYSLHQNLDRAKFQDPKENEVFIAINSPLPITPPSQFRQNNLDSVEENQQENQNLGAIQNNQGDNLDLEEENQLDNLNLGVVNNNLGADNQLQLNQLQEEEELMAEDKAVTPSLFKGKGENGEDWLRHFDNYCAYKDLAVGKQLALFKVLMTELAGDWLASWPVAQIDTLEHLKAAFEARYTTPEMVKYRSAKDLFSRKQQAGESVDDYCAQMQKIARVLGTDDRTVVYCSRC